MNTFLLLKKRQFSISVLLLMGGLVCPIQDIWSADYYSNVNKGLFALPKYSALGGASMVFSTDATPVSNPANIAIKLSNAVALAYTGYYENTFSTSVASYVMGLNENVGIGASVGYLFIPDIEATADLDVIEGSGDPIYDPGKVTMESSSEVFLHLELGYKFLSTTRFDASFGAALHCQRRRLIDWTGYGIGLDAGASFVFKKPEVTVSLLLEDITTNYIYWSSDYKDNGLPHARLGLGKHFDIPYIYGAINIMYKSPDLLSNDGVGYNWFSDKRGTETEPKQYSVRKEPSLLFTAGAYGVEYTIHKIVTLRLGLDEPKRFSFGGGVSLLDQSLLFDFAYLPANELPGTYSLSLSYVW